jgi:sugar (pentulose or hexulose) kinase
VAQDLGIVPLVPNRLGASWDVLGTLSPAFARKTGLKEDVLITLGIHDSNASLLPHFAKQGEQRFVLNSTGTWYGSYESCIGNMNSPRKNWARWSFSIFLPFEHR